MNWPLFFRYFVAAAWQCRLLIVVILFVSIAVATLYITLTPPKYKTSWVVLLPGTERASTLSLDNIGEARSSGKNAYGSVSISPKSTYKEIALSDAVINKAAKEYGVEPHVFSKPRITLIDQTPAIRFSLKGESYTDLKRRAILYNDMFHAVLDQLRKNEIERNYLGVENNLSEAKKRLSLARKAIVDYQNTSNIVSEKQFQAWLTEAETIRAKQNEAQVEHATLQAKINMELEQLGLSQAQAKAFLLIQANPANQEAIAVLSEKLAEQARIQKVYGPRNPLRKQLEKEIQGIVVTISNALNSVPELKSIKRNQLYALLSTELGTNLHSVNGHITDLEATRAKIKILSQQQDRALTRIKDHTTDAANLSDLKRSHQIAEAIFSSALAKLDTSRLDIYATYPLTQLLTEPGSTIKRDKLHIKLMIAALILVFGLFTLAVSLRRLRHNLLKEKDNNALNSAGISEPH